MRRLVFSLLVVFGGLGLVLCGTSYWGWSPKLLEALSGLGIGIGLIFVAWSNNRIGPKQVKNLVLLSASICVGIAAVAAFNFFY